MQRISLEVFFVASFLLHALVWLGPASVPSGSPKRIEVSPAERVAVRIVRRAPPPPPVAAAPPVAKEPPPPAARPPLARSVPKSRSKSIPASREPELPKQAVASAVAPSDQLSSDLPTRKDEISPLVPTQRAEGSIPEKSTGQRLAVYVSTVRAGINSHKSYPALARRRAETGVTTVTIRIADDGRLEGVSVAGARSPLLRRAARDAVEAAAPFGPPPDGPLTIEIEIRWEMLR